MKHIAIIALVTIVLTGCKYYGSALPPEYPLSMDDAYAVSRDNTTGQGASQRPIVRKISRPRIERPTYVPEKELAVVAAPKTLLVWTFPHVTDNNTRVFGSWSTIFLKERYEWVKPANAIAADDMIQVPAPHVGGALQ